MLRSGPNGERERRVQSGPMFKGQLIPTSERAQATTRRDVAAAVDVAYLGGGGRGAVCGQATTAAESEGRDGHSGEVS